jgi:hypothetical protein
VQYSTQTPFTDVEAPPGMRVSDSVPPLYCPVMESPSGVTISREFPEMEPLTAVSSSPVGKSPLHAAATLSSVRSRVPETLEPEESRVISAGPFPVQSPGAGVDVIVTEPLPVHVGSPAAPSTETPVPTAILPV